MTTTIDLQIDSATDALQSLPPVERALIGREQLIMGRVLGRKPGSREHRLMRLLSWSGRPGLLIISLILLLKRVWVQRRFPSFQSAPTAFFIGINALNEEFSRQKMHDRFGDDYVFVDQRQMEHFTLIGRLRLGAALKEWLRLVPHALKWSASKASGYAKIELRSAITMRLPDLAHLMAQFRELHMKNSAATIVCSNHALPAHAACIQGFLVEFHQHGFLSRTAVYPDFTVMNALTRYEGQHVASRVKNLKLNFPSADAEPGYPQRVLALCGQYSNPDEAPTIALCRFALDQGYRVVIRPHPFGDYALWRNLSKMDGVLIDRNGNIDSFLAKWQPAFLATWFSTTLMEGLRAGAVPITLSPGRPNLVFPFDEISMGWPCDHAVLERCMNDDAYRYEKLKDFARRLI